MGLEQKTVTWRGSDSDISKKDLLQRRSYCLSKSSSSASATSDTSSSNSVCSDDDQEYLAWENSSSYCRSRERSGTWPRTRSLNAPSPIQQFGPCGRIKHSPMVMQIQDPAFQRLGWYKAPLTVLVIKKTRDVSVYDPFVQLTRWLIEEKRMMVYVESAILNETALAKKPQFLQLRDKLQTFREGRDDLTDKIDFIICLGGDGTLLYASSLFQQSVPPVMAFHLGSLGFLTPFLFDNFEDKVTSVLEGQAALTLRSRLKCVLKRTSKAIENGSCSDDNQGESLIATNNNTINTSATSNGTHTKNSSSIDVNAGRSTLSFLVLNDVVVDRGPSPYLSNVDLYVDGKHVTVVQGDGLIISTPTGSTAYAVAAGASMIHPSVPAIMITPICPHSLSFRPIVVPAGVELKIKVPNDSRNTAWVSFDGRNRQELRRGDSLSVTTSVYPVPSICAQDQIQDWFDSLADCLQWNVRKSQKKFEEQDDTSEFYDSQEVFE